MGSYMRSLAVARELENSRRIALRMPSKENVCERVSSECCRDATQEN